MDVNRNQYFLAGLVLLLLGLQIRLTDSVVLTPHCTSFLAAHAKQMAIAGSSGGGRSAVGEQAKASARTVHPPEWLGWALLSLASVLILHSMAMKRPE